MINTVIERLEQYWTTFCNAPVELQVAGGALGIGTIYMVSGATGKLWKLLLPVRWVSAKTLALTSTLLYKGISFPKIKREETPYFNTDTFKNFEKTCDYYRKKNRVEHLSREDLSQLHSIKSRFSPYMTDKDYSFISDESTRRLVAYELQSINDNYSKKK